MAPLTDHENNRHLQDIGGTIYAYDPVSAEFFQCDAPGNKIAMNGRWEENIWTQFFFDERTKNIYTGEFPNGERPVGVRLVLIPSLPYCSRLGIRVKSYEEKLNEYRLQKQSAASIEQDKRKSKKRIKY